MKNYSNYNKKLKEYAREKRNNSTFGEVLLWKNLLSKRRLGYQFNRQFPIENFIVDFISRKLCLIIEIDGYSHQFKYEKDNKRDKRLQELGFNVLRFQEKDIKYDFHNVVRAIEFYIHEFEEKQNSNPPNPLRQGGIIPAAKNILEIACFNSESCLTAQKAGAHRIELCENYKAGGVSPSEELIIETRGKIKIPLFVMVRPREGNFIYSAEEFDQMKKQILLCRENKCDGLVFGILTSEKKVDVKRCAELVELAKPLPCTFHRAFDETANPEEAMEEIISCSFKRILTSGKQKAALEGMNVISSLIKKAAGRIIIMPGGGIRSSNISELKKKTGAGEFHSAAITDSGEINSETEIKNILSVF